MPNIPRSKGNQTIEFGQLIENNNRKKILQKLWRKWAERLLQTSFCFHKNFYMMQNYGNIILNRSSNSSIPIETSAPQEVRDFIVNHYFGVSNVDAVR